MVVVLLVVFAMAVTLLLTAPAPALPGGASGPGAVVHTPHRSWAGQRRL